MQSKSIFRYVFLLFCGCICSFGQIVPEYFTTTITKISSYSYYLSKTTINNEKKPLVLYLHGSGEKGTDISKVFINSPIDFLEKNYPDCYVLAPQCPSNASWDAEILVKLIENIVKDNPIDPKRIYLIGVSMGAWACWNLLALRPDLFAAAVAVSGFVDRIPMIEYQKFSKIPIYMYHGDADDIVPFGYSENLFNKLKLVEAPVILHRAEGEKHSGWAQLFQKEELYSWLMNQHKV